MITNAEKVDGGIVYIYDLNGPVYIPGFLMIYELIRNELVQWLSIDQIILSPWGDIHDGIHDMFFNRKIFMNKYPSFAEFSKKEIRTSNLATFKLVLGNGISIYSSNDSQVRVFIPDNCLSGTFPFLAMTILEREFLVANSVPYEYIREKAVKAVGPESYYLKRLLEDWKKDREEKKSD